MFRRLLQRAVRKQIIRKRLPPDLGGAVIYCTPDAMLSMLKPGWRSGQAVMLFQWARWFVQPGSVVWDLGANQGLFTFAAAARAGWRGQVVALEPDPFLFGLMHETRTRNKELFSSTVVLPLAAAESTRVSEFHIARTDRALNHLADVSGNPGTDGVRESLHVVTCTVDWLGQQLPAPNLIKIDVEGSELIVLRSALNLIRKVRPVIIVEVAPENTAEVGRILRDFNYQLLDAKRPDEVVESPAWNTICVPQERFVSVRTELQELVAP